MHLLLSYSPSALQKRGLYTTEGHSPKRIELRFERGAQKFFEPSKNSPIWLLKKHTAPFDYELGNLQHHKTQLTSTWRLVVVLLS